MRPPMKPKTTEAGNRDEPIEPVPIPSWGKLLNLGRPERRMIILAVILMFLAEATGMINPAILAAAYDYLIDPDLSRSQKMKDINRVLVTVIIIHFTGVSLFFVRSWILTAASERIVARLRTTLYSSVLKQEIGFFDEHSTGELVSRLSSDTTLIQQAASSALPEVMVGFSKVIVAIALMFYISPELAGVSLGFVAVILILCMPFGTALGKLSKAYQDILGQAQTHSTEALGAMRTVQAFAAEDREEERYRQKIGEPAKLPWWWPSDYKTNKTTNGVGFFKAATSSGLMSIVFGLGFGSMYFALWYGFKLVNDGSITLGELTAFQSYIFQIGASMGQTTNFLTQVIEARGASGRVFQLLEREPAIPAKEEQPEDETQDKSDDVETAVTVPKTLKPSSMTGEIEFTDVSFSYPSRSNLTVLRDFTLSIQPNTTAALVGSSGAGKSTVVALLQRFYDVTGGSITIDGNDIRKLDLKWLRSHIGYVQQEPQLFGLTVRENLCYGVNREVAQDEIDDACREANAYDFIQEWPNKYETLVGERGVRLSGGQKQRLAIARALLVNPRILLLDEATSALDAESEHLVQEAIDNAIVGRTVVIVAHRLSTIKNADQIVVIDKHKIVDVGSHDSLLSRCEKYQELIKRQSVIGVAPPPKELLSSSLTSSIKE